MSYSFTEGATKNRGQDRSMPNGKDGGMNDNTQEGTDPMSNDQGDRRPNMPTQGPPKKRNVQ